MEIDLGKLESKEPEEPKKIQASPELIAFSQLCQRVSDILGVQPLGFSEGTTASFNGEYGSFQLPYSVLLKIDNLSKEQE